MNTEKSREPGAPGRTLTFSPESLAALLGQDGPGAAGMPVVRFEGAEKLSARLLEFAHPLIGHLHHSGNEPDRERWIGWAVIAWNVAVSETMTRNFLAGLAEKYGEEALGPGGIVPTAEWLIERRRRQFRDDPRIIGAVRYDRLIEDHHVSVLGAFWASGASRPPPVASMPAPAERPPATAPELHRLLAPLYTWGEPFEGCRCDDHDWAGGFDRDDVPALVSLAWEWGALGRCDEDVCDEEFWAPFHAWRVLRGLKAPEGVWPMLGRLDDLDRANEEDHFELFLDLCTEVGLPAVPPLTAYLRDPARRPGARSLVADALGLIGDEHAACRPECLAALLAELASYQTNDPGFNGSLVDSLAYLEAAEAEPLVKAAFAAGRVDTGMCGPEENVLRGLRGEGLRLGRPIHARPKATRKPRDTRPTKKDKARAQRKREKAARRKNSRRAR